MRLAAALIYAKDLPALAAFYEHALQLKPIAATRRNVGGVRDRRCPARAARIPPHLAEQIEITSPPAVREETPLKLRFAATTWPQSAAASKPWA